jgi:hypothetical protein
MVAKSCSATVLDNKISRGFEVIRPRWQYLNGEHDRCEIQIGRYEHIEEKDAD